MRTDRPFHAHHVQTRGAGGDDSDLNLIRLCDICHGQFHRGKIAVESLEAIVSTRQEAIKSAVDFGSFTCPDCKNNVVAADDGFCLKCSDCGHLLVRYRAPNYADTVW